MKKFSCLLVACIALSILAGIYSEALLALEFMGVKGFLLYFVVILIAVSFDGAMLSLFSNDNYKEQRVK